MDSDEEIIPNIIDDYVDAEQIMYMFNNHTSYGSTLMIEDTIKILDCLQDFALFAIHVSKSGIRSYKLSNYYKSSNLVKI